MKVIDKENACKLINENLIQRESSANVYIWADAKEMGISFAYSDRKNDEIILTQITTICHAELCEELWEELLQIAKELASKYQVRLVIDDVRPKNSVCKGVNVSYE